jgi:hypothetical protein
MLAFVLPSGCRDDAESASGASKLSGADWAGRLSASETFTWDDQPISFAPPPSDWFGEREQSGGLMGVRYVKRGSVGERIHVAEYGSVGKRDRCSELAELARDLDQLSEREFQTRLQRARPYAQTPINSSEEEGFEGANSRLDDARDAFRDGDLDEVRDRISAALWDLRWVEYTLEEVVTPALFTGEGYQRFGRVEVSEPIETSVADQPGLSVDYTLVSKEDGRTYRGREVYAAYNNRLFVASFQGLEENLPLFDALVDSVEFPTGSCEH